MTQNTSTDKTNIGKNLLETLTSALYEDPIVLFREYVQNSVDAYKYAVKKNNKLPIEDFRVLIDIDEKTKRIIIRDNGYGIFTTSDFTRKMRDFGISEKKDRSEYIGFRGIGRLSAMPFCATLTFRNKSQGSDFIDICRWNGDKYRDLLNSDDDATFEEVVKSIVEIDKETITDIDQHFFEVIVDNYTLEVDEMLNNTDKSKNLNFEQRLKMLLPLKYAKEFTAAEKIIQKYNEFMTEDLNEFMYSVYLNGKELRKIYNDNHILFSDIIFWELREKPGPNNRPNGKMGILWFTFNKKIALIKKDDPDYGILVRSKNVLMGNNDTFAVQASKSKEYVTTYRELAQDIIGVYGELLINSQPLSDNARRDWFKIDEHSIFLRHIIANFMSLLHTYRYSSSAYFNNQREETREKYKAALRELIDYELNSKIDLNSFDYDLEKDPRPSKANQTYQYADDDIPKESRTKKKAYDEIMTIIEEFFDKEKRFDLFLKLRAFIKRNYNK